MMCLQGSLPACSTAARIMVPMALPVATALMALRGRLAILAQTVDLEATEVRVFLFCFLCSYFFFFFFFFFSSRTSFLTDPTPLHYQPIQGTASPGETEQMAPLGNRAATPKNSR